MSNILPYRNPGAWSTIDSTTDPGLLRPRDEELLRRAYYPFQAMTSPATAGASTVPLLQRDDYVLLYMPVSNRTEMFYRHMAATEPAISTPIASIKQGMMAYGWKFKPAGSTPAQKRLAGMAEAQAAAIPQLAEVFGQIAGARYYGWQPLQLIWSARAFGYKTKRYWGIERVYNHRQDALSFNLRRELVQLVGPEGYRPIDDPREQLAWAAPSSGDLLSPYGHALLSDLYVYWAVKTRMFEYFVQGMRNATQGIPKFRQNGVGASLRPLVAGESEGQKILTELTTEVKEALYMLREYGALVLRAGMDCELILNESYAKGWEAGLDYCDKRMQIRIEMSHLTMELKGDSTGSRAIGEVQETSKDKAVRWTARGTAEDADRYLFHRALLANYPSADPDDMPRLVFRITDRIDPTRAQAFKALGGRLDLEAVAEDWGLPIMTPGQIAAEDAANLAKAQAMTAAASPVPQPKATGADPNAATGGEGSVDPPSPEDQPN